MKCAICETREAEGHQELSILRVDDDSLKVIGVQAIVMCMECAKKTEAFDLSIIDDEE
jgi:hypothetical protein